MDLVVVGSVAYDSVETKWGKRDNVLGGAATFFSVAASHFTRPGLVGVVGDDFRQEDVALMERCGVDLAGLERTAGRTFRWGGVYHDDMNGRDTLFTELNVFEAFEPKLPSAYQNSQFLFLANIHPSLQSAVLEQVDNPRFVGLDTMNLWIDISRNELVNVLERVDALFVNDEEARQLTGKHNLREAAAAIREMGPSIAVIKRGEYGAIVFSEDDIFIMPAFLLERVVDPTGAGDTFAGGFMGHLAKTQDLTPTNLRRAAVVGSVMASFCVEGFSLDTLEGVSMDDVTRRYREFIELTSFEGLRLGE
jgi:sugar/nucleoside kinase (ribokinase family)